MTLRFPKSAVGSPVTPRRRNGGSTGSMSRGSQDESKAGVWKAWILIALEALLFYGLVGFAHAGLTTGAFSAVELGGVCARVLVYALAFVVMQVVFKSVSRPLLFRLLPASKLRGASANARVLRTSASLFKLLYNVVIVGVWQVVLTEESTNKWPEVLPDWRDALRTMSLKGAQGPEVPWTPGVVIGETTKSFYLLILGYLTSELILLLPDRDRADYHEMLIHHVIAVSLTLFSYLCGFLRVGALILYVHHVSDLFIYASRSTVEVPNRAVVGGCFSLLVCSFFYCRLCLFPFVLMKTSWLHSLPVMQETFYLASDPQAGATLAWTAWLYFNSALCVLYTLNGYWWLLILRVGLNFARTGRARDVRLEGDIGASGSMRLESRAKIASPGAVEAKARKSPGLKNPLDGNNHARRR